MASSSLHTIYGWNLNLNNVIGISLVHDSESKYQKYFAFFNLAKGVTKQDGTRTYDFKNYSINFKLRLEKLFEFYTVLSCYARGQMRMVGPYSVVNDTSKSGYGNGGGMKTLYFNYKPESEEGGSKSAPGIVLNSKYGDKSISTFLPIPAALTLAEMCKKIFDMGIEEDMEHYVAPTYESRGSDFEDSSSRQQSQNSGGGSEDGYATFTADEVPF